MEQHPTTSDWIAAHHDTELFRQWVSNDGVSNGGFVEAVDGQYLVQVADVEASDASALWPMPDGTSAIRGVRLRELRERFGGDEGHLTNPVTGDAIPVSLAPWRDRDPDTTVIAISWRFRER